MSETLSVERQFGKNKALLWVGRTGATVTGFRALVS
jgi:hypothetical protein